MPADRSDLRLSDAERQEALGALEEHVRTGRLDVVEYDERSARVSAAKVRRDLEPVFADLPEPGSEPGSETGKAVEPAQREHAIQQRRRKLGVVAVPAAVVGFYGLFFATPYFGPVAFVLLLPLVITLFVFASRRRG